MAGGLLRSALVPEPPQFVDVLPVHAHEIPPPVIVTPAERRLDGGARGLRRFDEFQRHFYNGRLHRNVVGGAAGIPEREVGEKEPGDSALLDDVPRRTHNNRGDTGLFEMPGDQTHGLVAHRSEANQQCGIDTVLTAPAEQGRGINGVGLALTVRRGNAVEPG